MNDRRRPRKPTLGRWAFLALLFVASLQFGVHSAIIRKSVALLPPTHNVEAVLVFTGDPGRIRAGMETARRVKSDWLFVTRTSLQEIRYYRMERDVSPTRVAGDYHSRTTDSDARAAALFVREKGARRVVLVTAWYHVPRATLLTSWYLRGQGVKLRPTPSTPPPPGFFLKGVFWLEMAKTWGSLYRALRHALSKS